MIDETAQSGRDEGLPMLVLLGTKQYEDPHFYNDGSQGRFEQQSVSLDSQSYISRICT
jgi:hypothetical protein